MSDDIASMQTQLLICRQRLAYGLEQAQRYGDETSFRIAYDIHECRETIHHLKHALRAAAVLVDDQANDTAQTFTTLPASTLARLRTHDIAMLHMLGQRDQDKPFAIVDQTDFCAALQLTPSQVRAGLKRLATAGYVETSETQGGFDAWLTDEGRELTEADQPTNNPQQLSALPLHMMPAQQDSAPSILAHLSTEDRQVLQRCGEYVISHATEYIDTVAIALPDDVPQDVFAETLDMLVEQRYIERKHGLYVLTLLGLNTYARAYIPEYDDTVVRVEDALVQQQINDVPALAAMLHQNLFLISHIVKYLEADGLVRTRQFISGPLEIRDVSVGLKRRVKARHHTSSPG